MIDEEEMRGEDNVDVIYNGEVLPYYLKQKPQAFIDDFVDESNYYFTISFILLQFINLN